LIFLYPYVFILLVTKAKNRKRSLPRYLQCRKTEKKTTKTANNIEKRDNLKKNHITKKNVTLQRKKNQRKMKKK